MGIFLLLILVALAVAALPFGADSRGGREYSVGALLEYRPDDRYRRPRAASSRDV